MDLLLILWRALRAPRPTKTMANPALLVWARTLSPNPSTKAFQGAFNDR